MNDRDIIILKKMIQYADEIALTVEKLDLDFQKFETDFIAKNAIAMCVLQIGELVGKLTDDFKTQYHKMPWRDIKSMRTLPHITMANWILRYCGKQLQMTFQN